MNPNVTESETPEISQTHEVVLCPADTNALLRANREIRRAVFTVENGIAQSVEQDELDGPDSPDSPCRHFVVERDGNAVGALRCTFPAQGVVQLQRFCILSHVRGRGVGRAALAALEDYYRPTMHRIELDAKFHVEGFYRACGYRTISEKFVEAGVEHVKMRKDL